MNTIRALLNLAMAAACFSGGFYLLAQGSLFLRDRWHPEVGSLFSGLSLYLLVLGLFSLSAFTATVAVAWIRGTVPMPKPDVVRPDPAYKGLVILRYWYLVVPAVLLVMGAFILAKHVPAPPQ
jgi:hypothetical protein